MASTSSFRIFPSPVVATEIDLSKPQLSTYQRRSTELKGVAFHLPQPNQTTAQTGPSRVQPEKRSQSPGPPCAMNNPKPRSHQRKRSSAPNLGELAKSSGMIYETPADLSQAVQSVKPSLALRIPSSSYSVSTYSEPMSCVRTTPATSVADTPQTDYTSISSASDTKSGAFPLRSYSLRSGSSAVSRVTNFSKRLPIIPASPQDAREARSLFPQYDPTKPLSQQKYFPQQSAVAITTPAPVRTEKARETAQPLLSALKRQDSAVVLEQGYECLPEVDNDDLSKLWSASTRLGACGGRKTHLPLHTSAGLTSTYSVGYTSCPLFSAKVDRSKEKDGATQLSISKANPQTQESHLLANLALPIKSQSQASNSTENTHIFPHQAAVDALTAASNSPQAAEIARFDPQATSRAAETLAKEAVNDAHRSYTSELIRTTRRHSTFSKTDYKLQHSIVGDMVVTVTQSTAATLAYTTSPATRMRVVLHHPSATQAAIAAETLALLSLDLGRNACVIDLPSILGLEAEYMLDTAIAAVFATLASEQDSIGLPEAMVFEAPPTAAVNDKKKKARSKLSKSEKAAAKKEGKPRRFFWPLRKTGATELDEKVEDMPQFAKTAVAAVELSLHGAFWLLEKGAKTLDEKGRGRL